MGYGFVCFKTQDGAYKAKIDGQNILFNGCKLFISQFETKTIRQAHLAEKMDRIQFLQYQKQQNSQSQYKGLFSLLQLIQTQPFELLMNYLLPLTAMYQQYQ
jgi:hypothetical protein